MKLNFENDTNEIFSNLKNENKFFYNKNILLVGSNGFLGKYFLKYFLKLSDSGKRNLKIDCVDNNISSKYNKKFNKEFNKDFNFIKGDISKMSLKKKYNIIIFLAGIASPFIYRKYPIETLKVSYEAVKNLLDKSKRDKSLFIFFSSSEIYGNPNKDNIPTEETYYGHVNSFGPRSCYDEGKRIGETLCYVYKNYFKVKIKIIRPFNVFGPGMDPKDYRVIPNIISKIKNKEKIQIFGNGNQTRTFCYITDALTGFIKIIVKGKTGEIYNVGNNNNEISMNKLITIYKKILKKNIEYKYTKYPEEYPADEPIRRCPDISKLKKDTGYTPFVSIHEGLKRNLKYLKLID